MLASYRCSSATLVRPPSTLVQQTDSLTGMILPDLLKKQRAANGAATAGYSPELSKALKSVVKIFTTMAK